MACGAEKHAAAAAAAAAVAAAAVEQIGRRCWDELFACRPVACRAI